MKTDLDKVFEEKYKSLNKAQKEAVDSTEGPVMVIAGPGSGKTELLSLRVGKILQNGTAYASNILCLTFTETAADNMRKRLETMIGPDAYRVVIYTFHSFCTDVIGKYPEYFYNASHFSPASDLTQSEILENIFEKLPHGHILGSYHPDLGYAFLKESQSRIKDIKKGGLTPEKFEEELNKNKEVFEKLNKILQENLPERIGKDSYASFEKMKSEFTKTKTSLGDMYAHSIGIAQEEVDEQEKTTPLSEWKTKYTGKDESDDRVFKDFLNQDKLYALNEIYKKYQEALFKDGHFDYEDMIIQVVSELERNITLRNEIEEQYQYIMVDEFQDTNNAQLSLVKAISSAPVHEGRPNVCVVGDDDQAVYKFQGAEISNIHSFQELYKNVKVVVLTENYRSTQKILNFARSIVTQGKDRLETRYQNIRKDLIAKNESLPVGEIKLLSFDEEEKEYANVAKDIKNLLKEKTEAKEIAIIAREHKQLNTILPYLDKLSIPYSYTRKENVFDEIHIKELVTICRFLSNEGSIKNSADYLLPEILAFPFWELDRISVWKVAVKAKKENISWLDAMQKSEDKNIVLISEFLIELSVASQETPLEIIIDTLIGSRSLPEVTSDEEDDNFVPDIPLKLKTKFTSPYKEFYFGKNALKENASHYINFLSSLKVFVHALREWREGELLKAEDIGQFVDMHVSYNIPLINETAFSHNENSVQLLTSHKAKGLEFEHVFVISLNDKTWASGSRASKISFPINLPLKSAGDSEDDFIRLFFVAITRAKHTLYLSYHKEPLRFLTHPELREVKEEKAEGEIDELTTTGLQIYNIPPFANDEKALLQKVLENYMLSPTHLNNYLDIVNGGPMKFIEQNLLRFPQSKTVSSVYGSAIHKALEDAHILARKDKKLPKLETIIEIFNKELKKGRLLPHEEEKQMNRGEKVLQNYYELKKDEIKKGHLVEINFAKQGVKIGDALLTGKIDKVLENGDDWTVVDLKTGKGFSDWDDAKADYDKLKLHKYKQQLMMYKLLVENSRDYSKHKVTSGVLEFVENESNKKIQELTLDFDDKKINELKKLVNVVYKKIINLEMIDTEKYEKSLEGVKEFEEELIEEKI